METLIELLNSGWNVSFVDVPKRIDGEMISRLIWKATYRGSKKYECKWEGFEDAIDCINDFIQFAKQFETIN